MRHTDTFITGLGAQLGSAVNAEDAIHAGQFDPGDAALIGQQSVSCSAKSALELALAAGEYAVTEACQRAALTRSSLLAGLAVHLHSSVCSPGLEAWSPSCYLLRALGGVARPGLSAELSAASNGGPAAIEMAAAWRTAHRESEFALVTAADKFVEPFFPRWRSERGMVFGDGAAAAILGPHGPVRILATTSYTDPTMEGLHRGNEPVQGGGAPHKTPIDLRSRSRAHVATIGGPEEVKRRHTVALGAVFEQVQADTGLKVDDFTRIIFPFFGRNFIEDEYLQTFDIQEEKTLLQYGLTIGHLGASDHLVGLHHLLRNELVHSTDTVLLVGIGAGFTWTAVALEVS